LNPVSAKALLGPSKREKLRQGKEPGESSLLAGDQMCADNFQSNETHRKRKVSAERFHLLPKIYNTHLLFILTKEESGH